MLFPVEFLVPQEGPGKVLLLLVTIIIPHHHYFCYCFHSLWNKCKQSRLFRPLCLSQAIHLPWWNSATPK